MASGSATEGAALAVVGVALAWGLTRQPGREPAALAATPSATVRSAKALPEGSLPPAPPAPTEAQGCGYADRGMGDFEVAPAAMGRLLVRRAAVQENGSYRLLVHFHGADAVKRLLTPEAWDMNLLLVDAGDGSGAYRNMMASTAVFDSLVESADRSVSKVLGRAAKADRFVLTSFSAGYGALSAVLASPEHRARIEGVVLLDSLHAPRAADSTDTVDVPDASTLAPFVAVARAAREGSMFLGVTHTSIEPAGYASTTETSRALLASLGLEEKPVGWSGEGGGLRATSQLAEGKLVVRGYGGETKEAHCAQLGLLPGLLRELAK